MHEQLAIRAHFDKVVRQAGAARVKSVRFALGEMAGFGQEIVRETWSALSKGTLLERVPLRFRLIHAEAQCMACFKTYRPANGVIHCPHCGGFGAKILTGEEFHVEHIEMEDE